MAPVKSNDFGKCESNCNHTFAGADPLKIIRVRSRLLALPKRILEPCIDDIEKWYQSNGPEWTVDRLKYIKQCAIRYLTMDELPPTNSEHWFKKNSKGLFYGHWGSVLKLMKSRPKTTALFLQCYTVFARKGLPTSKMIENYKNTLEEPFNGSYDELNAFNKQLQENTSKIAKKYFSNLLHDVSVPGNYLLDARANNALQTEDLLWSVQDFLTSEFGELSTEVFDWILPALGLDGYQIPNYQKQMELLKSVFPNLNVKPFKMANINWINEPGLKERVVADYTKVLEFLTKPFGEKLYEIIKQVPWDATYFETVAYEQIQRVLKDYKLKGTGVAYCFDLSKATDRFPLSTQIAVLRGLKDLMGPMFTEQMELFEYSCYLPAELPDGQLTHWEVGQPMGAFPSFALFSLTHGMVCMNYLISNNIPYRNQFVVHGDDIVIFDEHLAQYYQNYIGISGAKINMFKTIKSSEYVEFNSRLISANSIIQFPKWKPVTPASLLDQVSTWGTKVIDWCYKSKNTNEVVRKILSIPYILPNGTSINPNGTPELERFLSTPDTVLEFILYPKPVVKDFISNRQLVLRRFRADSFMSEDLKEFNSTINISSDLAELYMRMLFSALDIADTLDKEIQQDFCKFVEFTASKSLSDIITNESNTNDRAVSELFFEKMPHFVHLFQSEFGMESLVDFGYIRQQKVKKKNNSLNHQFGSTRLNKLVKLYKSSAV